MLITIVVILILLGLALYGVGLLPIDRRILLAIQLLLVAVAIIYIAREAGLA